MSVRVSINGESRDVAEGTTVSGLLESLGTMRNGIAVACNERVVRRAEYETLALSDGDTIEIIKAVAGG